MAVNNAQAANLTEGDILVIPANLHSDSDSSSSRASRSKSRSRGHVSSSVRASRSTASQHATHVAASRGVPAQILHRKAAVHTASLQR
jgi:hypothetical protein